MGRCTDPEMAPRRMPGDGPGADHARRRRPSASEERLQALGGLPPAPPAEAYEPIAHERAVRAMHRGAAALVLAVLLVVAGVQWFRPVPAPTFRPTLATSLRLAGAPPVLPWPATGSSALAAAGGGDLGRSGNTQPVPIAGLAKVMTAYVVLTDHPLAAGAAGPAIPVSAGAIATYQEEQASQQSTVPLAAGESLTELEALQGLLVASGNDMASLLADWDAGGSWCSWPR